MSAVDRKRAYNTLKPLLHAFIQKQLEEEQSALEMAKQMGFSNHTLDTQRAAPGRMALLVELPELLDREFQS